MSNDPSLSLVVLRVADLERSQHFYSAVGLRFELERHGKGPEHYAATLGNVVFELYPATDEASAATTRLGFAVGSVAEVVEAWRRDGYRIISQPKDSPWGRRAVAADPDGHRVELTQVTPASSASITT